MRKKIKQYILICLGVMCTAFSISVFYTPNKIVNGGMSGVSTILYHTFNIPPGLSFAVINIVLLLVAFKFMGKEFVIRTLVGAGLLSFFVQMFTYIPPITDDIVLATVCGAALYGIGIGITLVSGASTGGTDILGRLIQIIFPHIEIGRLLLIVDSAVILTSLAVFKNVELALWGVIALFVSSLAIDTLIRKLNVSKLAFIVSNDGDMIAKELVASSPRGVTILDSIGAYTMNNNKVLMCALKEKEIADFQKKVSLLDENAFIIYSEAQSIVGNGFYFYR